MNINYIPNDIDSKSVLTSSYAVSLEANATQLQSTLPHNGAK